VLSDNDSAVIRSAQEGSMPEMSVAERIRFFESRRSGNIYIVGHGHLPVRYTNFNFKILVKGKLKKRNEDFVTGGDSGGLGGTMQDVSFSLNKRGKPSNFQDDHAKFTVPNNMKILFYVPHGEPLANEVGRLIEGFTHGRLPPPPTETIPGGGKCYNYRLSYPHGLNVNVDPLRTRHDVITMSANRGDAYVPLSTILRDPRC
jgi:hypothetical protein